MKIYELFEMLENELSADYAFSPDNGEIMYLNKSALEYTPSVSEGDVFFRKICGRRSFCPDCPVNRFLDESPVHVSSDSLCSFGNVTFSAYETEKEYVVVSRWSEKERDLLESSGLFGTKEALSALGGDREIYNNILRTYFEDGQKKLDLLTRFSQAKDIPAFRVEVHGLKSASNIIGAYALSELCKKLEYACRDIVDADKDFGDIERVTPEEGRKILENETEIMIIDYKAVLEVIGKYLKYYEESKDARNCIEEIEFDTATADAFNELIEKAVDYLNEFDLDEARESIENAIRLCSGQKADHLKKALEFIDCFDYDSATGILNKLK